MSVERGDEVIVIRNGSGPIEIHTTATALNRLRSLAYEGALPGTHTERWRYSYNSWERTAEPWDAPS